MFWKKLEETALKKLSWRSNRLSVIVMMTTLTTRRSRLWQSFEKRERERERGEEKEEQREIQTVRGGVGVGDKF